MILINYHLLAILPTLLFSIGIAIRFISWQNRISAENSGTIAEILKEQVLFTTILESIALAAINGIILAELSGNFAAGTAFMLFGIFVGLAIISLLRNGYEDLSEYLIALMGLLFFYEFIYFLSAGTVYRAFGGYLIGWQIAVIWFFGIIAIAVGAFAFIVFMRMRSSRDN